MPRPSFHSHSGFTLLEISLAIAIGLIVMAVAIPSFTSVLKGSRAEEAFASFDGMVREARERSRSEGRNYVIVWGRERVALLRPEEPASPEEAKGLRRWDMAREGNLELYLPAALFPKGEKPDAIWTFWADGVCEPAEVCYKGADGNWSAVYNPFTGEAEVRYE